jgi:dienelactone hydrolase
MVFIATFNNISVISWRSVLLVEEIYNTCGLSKHIGNMCMRLRNAGKVEASPSLFPRFAPNTHIYLYASTVHMYCIYPAILNRK